jgi:hypothetical protein
MSAHPAVMSARDPAVPDRVFEDGGSLGTL